MDAKAELTTDTLRPKLAKACALVTLTAYMVWASFRGAGGLELANVTPVWEVTILLAGILVASSLLLRGTSVLYGGTTLALFGLFALFSGMSIAWSLIPSATFEDFNRNLAYLAAFAAAICAVRLWRDQWRILIGSLCLTVAILCGYALLTKVAPSWLAHDEVYGRLRAPFSYWNAVGLIAAMGLPLSLWLGTSAGNSRYIRMLALPFATLAIISLLFSYSRASLLVAIVGVALWFILVRTQWVKALAQLLCSTLVAALVLTWAFGQSSLTGNDVTLPLRDSAGGQLGVVLLVALVALLAVGFLIERYLEGRQLPQKALRILRRGLLVIAIALPVAFVVALAVSNKGLSGNVEHAWNSFTSSNGPPNSPQRLTSVSSQRVIYWKEAGKIWKAHPTVGAGAGSYEQARKHYRSSALFVAHAHGTIPQVLADLGIIGVLLVLLATVAWLVAAARALAIRAKADRASEPELAALGTLAIVAFSFGLHTSIDWTWYVPGIAVFALAAAGWVAGRGPFTAKQPTATTFRESLTLPRALPALLALFITVFAAWTALLPEKSQRAVDSALVLTEQKQYSQAKKDVGRARKLNPTSVDPLFTLSAIDRQTGDIKGGRVALEIAVKLQPANPLTWQRLGEYLLLVQGDSAQAKAVAARAVFLDPGGVEVQQLFIKATRAAAQEQAAKQIQEQIKKLRKKAQKAASKSSP